MIGNLLEAKKPKNKRPKNDFYQTPKCMIWELVKSEYLQKNSVKNILDPCCGNYIIGNELNKYGFNVVSTDIMYGDDFLSNFYKYERCDAIVMNPPFDLFDKFIIKSKKTSSIICSIGRLNYFGSHSRNIDNLWEHLEFVYVFDRQIAFDRELRDDGKVECGMMVTGWFIWNNNYNRLPKIKVIDMQKYILKRGEK